MLSRYINQILQQHPEYAGIIPVIEKEILHHDIMHVLVEQGVLQHLTFNIYWWHISKTLL
ncbi:hypothetical protein NBRC116592_12440 [Colwellia sp. KU-HH00111]